MTECTECHAMIATESSQLHYSWHRHLESDMDVLFDASKPALA